MLGVFEASVAEVGIRSRIDPEKLGVTGKARSQRKEGLGKGEREGKPEAPMIWKRSPKDQHPGQGGQNRMSQLGQGWFVIAGRFKSGEGEDGQRQVSVMVRKREILSNGSFVHNKTGDSWKVEERELEFGGEKKLVMVVLGTGKSSLPGWVGRVKSLFH